MTSVSDKLCKYIMSLYFPPVLNGASVVRESKAFLRWMQDIYVVAILALFLMVL